MGQAGAVPASELEFEAAFERIRGSIEAGDTDLSRLGFWRLLNRVKAEQAKLDKQRQHLAEQTEALDADLNTAGALGHLPPLFPAPVLAGGSR